ncbi:MAG: DUF3106 domain-containing protein [Pseudomonadota bacterium]|nr:DUF3106 domain-containing protein [Pseudomonadota bacterium]
MRRKRMRRGSWLVVALALAWPMLAALAQMRAATPGLAERTAAWEALTDASRRSAREEMHAWLRLPVPRQAELRAAAAAFAALPGEQQAALRARFDALPLDEQIGWRLGPTLGPWYPRLYPLLGYVPEAEREPLLAVLHSMPPQELDVLARLAFTTPPEKRAELRAALIRQPASGRSQWLMAQMGP